jgi:methionyl-tRNA synthetase
MKQSFYLTTTLPYVNSEPHIGFAQEIVAGDVISRYKKSIGNEVIFNTGTDEHGQKIHAKAIEAKKDPKEYVDFYAAKFSELKSLLDLSFTNFIRTTDKNHIEAAQEFWKRCKDNGDIYKKNYKTKYCVGCELEKQSSDLEDGRCPLHPTKELEVIEEENYFFKFSKYQQDLLNLYETNDKFVKPPGKLKEIKSFVSRGLNDFSISRLKSKMPWGIPVPDDQDHVMYVWFDALVNYVSTLGWPNDMDNFNKFWPVVQLAGKDNLRQQSAMWQAMLISAGISNSEQILINGFISVDGKKMSKSSGSVITPFEMVEKYGTDATRYLLMNLGPFGTDMDVSWEKFDATFTSELSNGLGNLCSRVAKMCEKNGSSFEAISSKDLPVDFQNLMNNYNLKETIKLISDQISIADQYLSKEQPWTKTGDEQTAILQNSVTTILSISKKLEIFMPKTAEKISKHFGQKNISALKPLFPRVS